jgi:GT2 family glycosyltransferase
MTTSSLSLKVLRVTVIVCTWNRSRALRAAVASLLTLQTDAGLDFEVLIVDDGSTDDTREVVRALSAAAASQNRAVDVRYVWQRNQGVAMARNNGVAHARGEWVAFFDDDQLAEPVWLAELLEAARSAQADVVGGPCVLELPTDGPNLPRTIRRLLGENPVMQEASSSIISRLDPRKRQNRLPGTGNALIRKSLFATVGTFAGDRTYGEDLHFFRRAEMSGARFTIAPRAIVRHVIPITRLNREHLLTIAEKGGRSQGEIEAALAPLMRVAGRVALRVMHLVGWTLPSLLIAWVTQDPIRMLSKQCSVRVAVSYVAAVASTIVRKRRLHVMQPAEQAVAEESGRV